MNLPLHQLIPEPPVALCNYRIDPSSTVLSSASATAKSRLYSLCPPQRLGGPLAYSESGLRAIYPYDGPSNILFLLPSGSERLQRTVLVWDDQAQEVRIELEHKEKVLGLQIRRDRLVVVLRRKLLLYHLDFTLDREQVVYKEAAYETCDNPLGLASLATEEGSTMLAVPGRQVGQVQLIRLPPCSNRANISTPRSSAAHPIVHIFLAHTSALRTLTLSSSGSVLATSSSKGTLLRVFSTRSRTLVRELRRGTDNAEIWSVCFSDPDRGGKLACASDKGTVHIWNLGDLSNASALPVSDKGKSRERTSSSGASEREKGLNVLKPYLPTYFSSTWSDLTWRIPESMALNGTASTPEDDVAICAFLPSGRSTVEEGGEQEQLVVVTRSGAWFRLSTSPAIVQRDDGKGGTKVDKHCKMLEYRRLVERHSLSDDSDKEQ